MTSYNCDCGKCSELDRLYWCIDCERTRCCSCVDWEILNTFCPSCLFEVPSTRSTNIRCSRNCLECPVCGATISPFKNIYICNSCFSNFPKPPPAKNILLEAQKHFLNPTIELTQPGLTPTPPLLSARYIKRCRNCKHILVKPAVKISDPFLVLYKASAYIPSVSSTPNGIAVSDPLDGEFSVTFGDSTSTFNAPTILDINVKDLVVNNANGGWKIKL